MNAEQNNLSAREILTEILAGKEIRVHLGEHQFKLLKANLNVLKSRDRKLYKTWGFDYSKMIIRTRMKQN
jgi:hypothetical protein